MTRSESTKTSDQRPARPKSEARQQSTHGRWAIVSLAMSMLLSSLGVGIPNVALPTLTRAFSASFHQVQWVVIAYLLAMTISIVSVGRLGDVLGHRKVLLAGMLLFTCMSGACGLAPTLNLLIAARAAQGIGGAILMALTVALVRQAVPKERTGGAMGLLGTTSAVGTALGPSVGGLLVAGPGWRAVFLFMVPLGLSAFALAKVHLPALVPSAAAEDERFDIPGMVLLGLSLGTYALAVTTSGAVGGIDYQLLFAAGLSAVLFLVVQAKTKSPLLRLAEFRSPGLVASLAMNVLVATVMMSTFVVGPFYLAQGLGLSEALVGFVMATGPVISILSGIPAGRLVDRVGAQRIVVIGAAQMACGALALASLPPLLGVVGYVGAMLVLTPGYQLFQAGNNTAVMLDVPRERRGVISGVLNLARNIGLLTGASVLGAVFAYAARATGDLSKASAEAVTRGMSTTFVLSAVLLVVAVGLGVQSLRRRAVKASSLSNAP